MLNNLNDLDFSSHFDKSANGAAPSGEPCLVSLRDGTELAGTVAAYDEQDAFDTRISCRCRRQQGNPAGHGADAAPDPAGRSGARRQALPRPNIPVHVVGKRTPFSLAFRDGRVMSGELLGYSFSPGGLGIYLASDDGRASRCFLPEGAVDDFTIGLPIGKVLLDARPA